METQALSAGGLPARGSSPAGHRVGPREAWPQSGAQCHLASSVKTGGVSPHIATEGPAMNTVPATYLPGLGGQLSLQAFPSPKKYQKAQAAGKSRHSLHPPQGRVRGGCEAQRVSAHAPPPMAPEASPVRAWVSPKAHSTQTRRLGALFLVGFLLFYFRK